MYLFLTDDPPPVQGFLPVAKIPTVLLPVAAPRQPPLLAAVAEAFTSPEYVYFSRVVETLPIAKIPLVEFPAAEPMYIFAVDAVATALVSLEYVYLFRIF